MAKQKGNKNWTTEEQEILDENIGFMPPSEIAKILSERGFSRTEVAIKNRCSSSSVSFACDYDNLSLRKIANLLKIRTHSVSNWYTSGWLPGKKNNRCQVVVQYKDVRKFLKSRKFRCKFDPDGLNFFLGEK
jgi:transposase